MTSKPPSPRRSVLDLAPLELDCMNTLWPMGEGTVRQIRDQLAGRRPRAYTTIMTIMDRLARKGVVERRKFGRAYIYRPNLSAEDARSQALGQVVENFFGGSREALLRQLNSSPIPVRAAPSVSLSAAAAAGSSSISVSHSAARPAAVLTMPSPPAAQEPRPSRPAPPANRPSPPEVPPPQAPPAESIDDTLL
jgi:BlaI family transcriptional regulator, penicillinase repressor